jgi:hypothetical protein
MKKKEIFLLLYLFEMFFSIFLLYSCLIEAEYLFTKNYDPILKKFFISKEEANEIWKRIYFGLICLSIFYLALILFLENISLNKSNTNILKEKNGLEKIENNLHAKRMESSKNKESIKIEEDSSKNY